MGTSGESWEQGTGSRNRGLGEEHGFGVLEHGTRAEMWDSRSRL